MKKIAVAVEGNRISNHFGHCEGFYIYETDEGRISRKTFIANPGHRPGFLPAFLKEKGVDVIIAGGMGASAQTLLAENRIEVFVGIEGDCDIAVEEYLLGRIESSGSVCREHEREGSC